MAALEADVAEKNRDAAKGEDREAVEDPDTEEANAVKAAAEKRKSTLGATAKATAKARAKMQAAPLVPHESHVAPQ